MGNASFDVLVGTSVNPEINWITDDGEARPGQKSAAEMRLGLSGTSYDVAVALRQANISAMLVGAVGLKDPLNGWLEHHLQEARLPYELLELRTQTAVAHVEPKAGRHLSFKPGLREVPVDMVRSRLRHISARVRVVTGLMPDPRETQLAKLLLDGDSCLRVLNPRIALVEDRKEFIPLLGISDWLVLNRTEAAAFFSPGETVDPAVFLDSSPSLKLVLVTKDREGATLYSTGGVRYEIPAFSAGPEVHATGAGDCFLGYFLAGHLMGWPHDRCLALAAVAAGIKVTIPGTASSPLMSEVLARLEGWEPNKSLPDTARRLEMEVTS